MFPLLANRSFHKLSVILPVFNEELVLPEMLRQLEDLRTKLSRDVSLQVLFVNNGSSDRSLEILQSSKYSFPVAVLTLSRNFGYESGLLAGIDFADSDLYALIDSDGEDDPLLLLDFYTHILQGSEIVTGIRLKRVEQFSTRIFRNISYFFLSKISDEHFIPNAGNFVMFTSRVREAIIKESRNFPFIRATISRTGFSVTKIPYNRRPRIDGKSKYRKFALLKFALAGFLTTTTWPLRLIGYLTLFNIPVAFSFGLYFHFNEFAGVPAITISYFTIQILIALSFLSLYVARIYKDNLNRPVYYVDKTRSFVSRDFKYFDV